MSKNNGSDPKPINQPKSQQALADTTYPAGMERERKEPALGDDKAGPRNPQPLPDKGE